MLIAHLASRPLDSNTDRAIPDFQDNDRYSESLLGKTHKVVAGIFLGSSAITALSFALAYETDKSFSFPNVLFLSAQTQQSLRRTQEIRVLVGAVFFSIACISGWIHFKLEDRHTRRRCAQRTEYLKAHVTLCKDRPLQEALKRLFVLNQRYIQMFSNQHHLGYITPSLRAIIQAPLKELCFELAAEFAAQDDTLTALDLLPIGSTERERSQWLETTVQEKYEPRKKYIVAILIDRHVANMPTVIAELVNVYARPLITVTTPLFISWLEISKSSR